MNQLKPKNKWFPTPLMLSLAALTVLGFVPFLSGAGGKDDTESTIRKIESLPVEQREQLQKNYITFRRLPEYRKIQYRNLNDELAKRSERFKVLKNYHEWLNTIPPDDAKSIYNEKDVSKKMALIQKLMEQNEPSRDSFFTNLFATRPQRNFGTTPRFTIEQLDKLFEAVISNLDLADNDLDRIQEMPIAEKHLRVVLYVHKTSTEQPAKRWSRLIDDERVQQLMAEVDKSRADASGAGESVDSRRRRFFQNRLQFNRILMASIADELEDELNRRKPSPEALNAFKSQIEESPKLQAKLKKLPDSNGLVLLYFETNDKEFANGIKEFSRLLKQAFQNRPGKRPLNNGQSIGKGKRTQRPRPLEKLQQKRRQIQKQRAQE